MQSLPQPGHHPAELSLWFWHKSQEQELRKPTDMKHLYF